LIEFDTSFNEKLSRSLEQALGIRIVTVVYSVLRSDFGIEKEDVPAHPEALKRALEKIFGSTGMDFLEMLISKEILTEFDLSPGQEDDVVLTKVLRKAQEASISRGKRHRLT
jgi:hypothetical protein